MSQDGRKESSAPGNGGPNDGLGLLQVVLLAYDSKGERHKDGDQYAAIRFPTSYVDAMASIQQSLGQYLKGGLKQIESIELLCPMANIDNEWIWAKADKKDWDLVIEEAGRTCKILAIRQPRLPKRQQPATSVEGSFTRGPVVLVYGTTKGAVTEWYPRISNQDKEWPPRLSETINRPVSYKDAVKLIIKGAKYQPNSSMYDAILHKAEDLKQLEFKFYTFTTSRGGVPTTDAWIEFPDAAYEDDKTWRTIVPEFNQILGFTLHRKRVYFTPQA